MIVTPYLEYATFRPRADVSEATVRAAYARITAEYMPGQPGLLSHDFFQRPDGTWVDLTTAETMEDLHRICEGWMGHAATQALLALIEPGSGRMAFLAPGPVPAFIVAEQAASATSAA